MFGYIRPLECELKVREQREYRAHYCGLCKAIGRRCGLLARLTLHYDCAFLSSFFAAYGGAFTCERKRCLCHPLRGRMPVMNGGEAQDYCADVNVLLSWHAACDGWQDEKKPLSLLIKLALSGAHKRAAAHQPALDAAITESLARLSVLERRGEVCTDEPADAFAALMRAVAAHAPGMREGDGAAVGWMFYNLGRWVYLIDAWDDRAKDQKSGAYNPFLAAGTSEEDAAFLLHKSLAEAENGYDLVPLTGDGGIVDNVMRLGCAAATRRVLSAATGDEG